MGGSFGPRRAIPGSGAPTRGPAEWKFRVVFLPGHPSAWEVVLAKTVIVERRNLRGPKSFYYRRRRRCPPERDINSTAKMLRVVQL